MRDSFTVGVCAVVDILFSSMALVQAAEQLSADAEPARVTTGHHAPRGAEDIDPQAPENARDVVAADVDAAAGLRHALDAVDDLLVVRPVLQVDADGAVGALADHLVVRDE